MEYIGNTWARIDLKALADNYRLLEAKFAAGRTVFSIVKTDAYGHGAVDCARALDRAGSQAFSVSSVLEAQELRRGGIEKPILILGYTPSCCTREMAEGEIHQCVFSLDYARELSQAAQKDNVTLSVHLKLDTGMGRLGFDCRTEAARGLQEAEAVFGLPNLKVEGIFMHFATADSYEAPDEAFARQQADRFWQAVARLEDMGHRFTYKHCCNSAATLIKEPQGNAIRPGIILYGLSPAEEVALPEGFRPVMSLYSTVSMVKTLDAGQSVSYGRTYVASGPRKIATVSAGYGDGVPRLLSGQGHVIIRGVRCPMVGRICMDQFCVDVTDAADVTRGDPVTIFGPGLPVEEVAAQAQTIPYEITCGITKRVRRVYAE